MWVYFTLYNYWNPFIKKGTCKELTLHPHPPLMGILKIGRSKGGTQLFFVIKMSLLYSKWPHRPHKVNQKHRNWKQCKGAEKLGKTCPKYPNKAKGSNFYSFSWFLKLYFCINVICPPPSPFNGLMCFNVYIVYFLIIFNSLPLILTGSH